MKKVVDCSGLSSPELPAFLSATRHNYAVLTDACQFEAFASGPKVQTLFAPFARYPGQALLLLPTWHIWRLRPRAKGFMPRLVDNKQTAAFPKYCHWVVAGHDGLLKNIAKKKTEAAEFLGALLIDATPLRQQMSDLIASYGKADLDTLRSGHRLTHRLCEKITRDVTADTATRLREAQGVRVRPDAREIKASLIFRFSVCHCALAIRRAAVGGVRNQSNETFRNDLNDCIYVSYATFYDGLITSDRGMAQTYNLARVRMSPDSLRRAAATGRDGRAKLAHQRIGISYRFSLRDIDNYGLIHAR